MSKTERTEAIPMPCSNCHTCAPNRLGGPMRMIVCPDCGNKRCPKANDCRNTCTGSNEPGQPGNAYQPAPTLQEVPEIGSPEAFAASDDPDCRQGGKACEGCLMVGWCLADFPPSVATDGGREHACCGALENGPHKMGCDHKLNAAPTDHMEDVLAMVPCAVCGEGPATLQRDDAGHYYRACEACGSDYAGAGELALQRGHVVDANKMVRPCRTCGPDGCADSVSCPRAAR